MAMTDPQKPGEITVALSRLNEVGNRLATTVEAMLSRTAPVRSDVPEALNSSAPITAQARCLPSAPIAREIDDFCVQVNQIIEQLDRIISTLEV